MKMKITARIYTILLAFVLMFVPYMVTSMQAQTTLKGKLVVKDKNGKVSVHDGENIPIFYFYTSDACNDFMKQCKTLNDAQKGGWSYFTTDPEGEGAFTANGIPDNSYVAVFLPSTGDMPKSYHVTASNRNNLIITMIDEYIALEEVVKTEKKKEKPSIKPGKTRMYGDKMSFKVSFPFPADYCSTDKRLMVLPAAIEMIRDMEDSNPLTIQTRNKTIWSDEVALKIDILLNIEGDREAIEDLFWKAEEHPAFRGEIMPLLKMSQLSDDSMPDVTEFSFKQFENYYEKICVLLKQEDLLRRALLAKECIGFPYQNRSNLSLAKNAEDWKSVIASGWSYFKGLMDDKNDLETIISETDISGLGYGDLIKYPELLQKCTNKNVRWDGDDLFVLPKTRATTFLYARCYQLYDNVRNVDWPSETSVEDIIPTECGGQFVIRSNKDNLILGWDKSGYWMKGLKELERTILEDTNVEDVVNAIKGRFQ